MSRGIGLLWLLIFVAALIFIGQTVGLYDLPLLRDLRLPLGVGPGDVPPPSVIVAPSIAPSPSPVAARPTAVVAGPCSAGRLSFANGMADLKAVLGTRMGEPTECERVVDAAGNTEQKTSTGLAYYRAQANVVVFTDGVEHWALTSNGVVHWTSDEVEPPPGAERVSLP